MKTVVIIIDLILCCISAYFAVVEFDAELPAPTIVFILIILLLILNVICIKFTSEKGWFSLYLKRKALEEKKKIDELSSK